MKKKIFGLTLAVVMVLGLNVVIFGGQGGAPWPPWPLSAPICLCLDCDCLNCPE